MNPDWVKRIVDEVDSHEARPPRRSIGLNYPNSMNEYIMAACRGRDMSLSAYARRSLMAVATYDLGLDWFTVMRDEPIIHGFGENGRVLEPSRADGNFGPWRIMSMEDYRDERH